MTKGSSTIKRARRRDMRTYEPIAGVAWRERRFGEVLPDQDERSGLGRRSGEQRCGAIGLGDTVIRDCDHDAWRGRVYCYYHDKVRLGMLEPTAEIYPVWPLPARGYVIINDRRAVA
jgi:hypothetical protein